MPGNEILAVEDMNSFNASTCRENFEGTWKRGVYLQFLPLRPSFLPLFQEKGCDEPDAQALTGSPLPGGRITRTNKSEEGYTLCMIQETQLLATFRVTRRTHNQRKGRASPPTSAGLKVPAKSQPAFNGALSLWLGRCTAVT